MGLKMSFVGTFAYRALYFGLDDTLKPMMGNNNMKSMVFSWSLPLLTGLLTYPFAMIRSRQTVTKESIKQAYDGQVKERGIIALWDGALLNIGRGLFGALVTIGIDELMYVFRSSSAPVKSTKLKN